MSLSREGTTTTEHMTFEELSEQVPIKELRGRIGFDELVLEGVYPTLIPFDLLKDIEEGKISFSELSDEERGFQETCVARFQKLITGESPDMHRALPVKGYIGKPLTGRAIPAASDAENILSVNTARIITPSLPVKGYNPDKRFTREIEFGDKKTKVEVASSFYRCLVESFGSSKFPHDTKDLERSLQNVLFEIFSVQNQVRLFLKDPDIEPSSFQERVVTLYKNSSITPPEIQHLASLELYYRTLVRYAQVHMLYALVVFPDHFDQRFEGIDVRKAASILSSKIYGEVSDEDFEYAVSVYLEGRRTKQNGAEIDALLKRLGVSEREKYKDQIDAFSSYEQKQKKEVREEKYEAIARGFSEDSSEIGKNFTFEDRIAITRALALISGLKATEISNFINSAVALRNEELVSKASLEDIIRDIRTHSDNSMHNLLAQIEPTLSVEFSPNMRLVAESTIAVLLKKISLGKTSSPSIINELGITSDDDLGELSARLKERLLLCKAELDKVKQSAKTKSGIEEKPVPTELGTAEQTDDKKDDKKIGSDPIDKRISQIESSLLASLLKSVPLSALGKLLEITSENDLENLKSYITGRQPFNIEALRFDEMQEITGWEVANAYKTLLESMGCGVDVEVPSKEGSRLIYGSSKELKDYRVTLKIDPSGTGFSASSAQRTLTIPAGKKTLISKATELFGHEFMSHIAGSFRARATAPILSITSASENETLAIAFQLLVKRFFKTGGSKDLDFAQIGEEVQKYYDELTGIRGFKKPVTDGLSFIIAIKLLNEHKTLNEILSLLTEMFFIDKSLTISDKSKARKDALNQAFQIILRVTRGNAPFPIYKDVVYNKGAAALAGDPKLLELLLPGKIGVEHQPHVKIFNSGKEMPFTKIKSDAVKRAFSTAHTDIEP